MGGPRSHCFLKAPKCFIEQIQYGVDMFTFNATDKLMKKVGADHKILIDEFNKEKLDDEKEINM